MRRTVFDVIRRGFDNILANWQLLVVRVVVAILSIVIMFGGLIAAFLPFILSLGLGSIGKVPPDEVIQNLLHGLAAKWLMVVWIFVAISILLLIFVALQSFVIAGCTRIYVRGEQQASLYPAGDRSRFAVFSLQEFFAGARDRWWDVFWVYNIVWGVAGVIVLLPAIPFMIVMVVSMLKHAEGGIACGGCGALIVMLFLGFFLFLGGAFLAVKAVVVAVKDGLPAREAIRVGWQEIKTDLGRHLAVIALFFAATMVLSAVFGGMSTMIGIMSSVGKQGPALSLAFLPVRLGISVVQSMVSEIFGMWLLASFVAITPETK